jgi:hypothetical protein
MSLDWLYYDDNPRPHEPLTCWLKPCPICGRGMTDLTSGKNPYDETVCLECYNWSMFFYIGVKDYKPYICT